MAKQRPSPKSSKAPVAGSAPVRSEARPLTASASPAAPQPSAREPHHHPPASDGPARRATYVEAIGVYERGMRALQGHDFSSAAIIFESILRLYPEEKELHERVRQYLIICARQVKPKEAAPQTQEERLYAATLAINGGRYDQAIANLRLVRDEDPDNDHALYMLAVAHAQRGEPAEAIAHLERAIALNPENRGLAKSDPDLEPIRGDDAFRTALDTPSVPRADRRRPPIRTRTAR
jgi:tetratricopeptide (TPR) repeat protein